MPTRFFAFSKCPTTRLAGIALALAVFSAFANSPAQAQTWFSATSSSTTASGATIVWTTAVPSDSQVEYGTTPAYGTATALAATKVTAHSSTLSGLMPGTTYHFRVRSSDSSAILVIGPDNTFTTAAPISISLLPQAVTLVANGTQQFTATVSNSTNKATLWSATAGSVSSSGLYTAPTVSVATTATITATSQADTAKSASAAVQVNPIPPISVSILPASGTLPSGGQQQFSATVSNASGSQVTWSANSGVITAGGLYTAPTVNATSAVVVTATSQSDTTKIASATLQITASTSSTLLIGDPALESSLNSLPPGVAEGYQMTASTTGALNNMSLYVDPATTATAIFVGLYSDSNGHPGALQTTSSFTTFQKAAWNTIPVPTFSIVAGSKYWLALLGTGGTIKFRQKYGTGGGIDELHSVRTLTSFPASWITGTTYAGGAWTSLYGSGSTGTAAGPPPVASSGFSVSPSNLTFTGVVGTSSLSAASVSIANTGTGTLSFTGVSDQPWLMISPASGNAPATIQVNPVITGLKAGTYTGHVSIAGGGTTKVVTAVLIVTAPSVQHSVALAWTTNAKVVSYSMYRSTISGGSYGLVASAIGGASYIDQGVQAGATYYYVLTAVDDMGRESAYSKEAKAVVP